MQSGETARIAFIGGGNMARALIAGLLRAGVAPDRIRVGEASEATRAGLQRDLGVAVESDNGAAVVGADLTVLAVKPQDAAAALAALPAHGVTQRGAPLLLLSIAAGLRIAELARLCPQGSAIVRAMPNRPALLGAGITALYAPASVTAPQRALAELIGAASGRAVWLRAESELDVVTALSGSGPAYFFLLAESMAQAAEALGLEPATARLLASETLHGAGLLAHQDGSLAEQRAAVTSRGGTTEAALYVLQHEGFEALVARALEAARARSAQLADTLAGAAHAKGP